LAVRILGKPLKNSENLVQNDVIPNPSYDKEKKLIKNIEGLFYRAAMQ